MLGNTGIGKSTIINYLLGAPFKSDGDNLHTKAKNIKAKISEDDYESETLYSKKYYGLENTYIDTAGLMDSRGEAERIWINYDIGTLIQSLDKIKAILILFNLADIKTSRAVSFKELTKITSLSIPSIEQFKKNILFIHNKEFGGFSPNIIRDGVLDGSRKLKKNYEKKLQKMQRENVSESGENLVDQIKLLDLLINSTKNDRLIVTNLVSDQTRNEIKARIRNFSNLNKGALKIKNGFDDGEFYEAVEKFIAPLVLLIENKFRAIDRLNQELDTLGYPAEVSPEVLRSWLYRELEKLGFPKNAGAEALESWKEKTIAAKHILIGRYSGQISNHNSEIYRLETSNELVTHRTMSRELGIFRPFCWFRTHIFDYSGDCFDDYKTKMRYSGYFESPSVIDRKGGRLKIKSASYSGSPLDAELYIQKYRKNLPSTLNDIAIRKDHISALEKDIQELYKDMSKIKSLKKIAENIVENIIEGKAKQLDNLDTELETCNKKLNENIRGGSVKNIDVIQALCEILELKIKMSINSCLTMKYNSDATVNLFINLLDKCAKIKKLEEKFRSLGVNRQNHDVAPLPNKMQGSDAIFDLQIIIKNDPIWKNFEIKKVLGDGNCFFTSVAKQLRTEIGSHQVREQVASHIQEHKDEYKEFITENFDKYIQDLRNGKWGGQPELVAASSLYNVNIIVAKPPEFQGKMYQSSNDNRKCIFLLYDGTHYDYLKIKEEREADSSVIINELIARVEIYNIQKLLKNGPRNFDSYRGGKLFICKNSSSSVQKDIQSDNTTYKKPRLN